MNKGLFIILDGTLITTKSGRGFPLYSEDWKFTTAWENLILNSANDGYIICIVDNQLVVGEGVVKQSVFNEKIETICSIIEKDTGIKKGSIITNFAFEDKDPMRIKPAPGLLYEVAMDYDILLINSILIGNDDIDEKFAKFAGIGAYYDLPSIAESLTK